MKVGSLFSGIGGIDLGLERAGMQIVWQCETDPYACRVLKKHWPEVPNLGDVRQVDWSTVGDVDVVAGGYPCQPFSLAGRRAGVGDDRHLWPYFAACLRVVRPEWAVLENVPGHLGLGFDGVLADLAGLGFDAEWELLPASAFGAPHLRYRLFVVAHTVGGQLRDQPVGVGRGGGASVFGDDGPDRSVADLDSPAWGSTWPSGQTVLRPAEEQRPGRRGGGSNEPLAGPVRPGLEIVERLPGDDEAQRPAAQRNGDRWGHWTVEPDVGRVAYGIPSRVDRLRCLGNAVVPQVAQWVGERIMETV